MLLLENNYIAIFFSQKSDGDMLFHSAQTNADWTRTYADNLNDNVRANRIVFFKKHEIDPARLVNLAGVHGAKIDTITRDSILGSGALDANTQIPETDGLITNIKNSYLMVTGADCFPVMFWDPIKKVIGTAHCGWRGIISGIIQEMVDKFKNEFDSVASGINVWIGPGIKSCHYSVSKERAELFSKNYKNHIIERGGQVFLDLAGIIALQLTVAGVRPEKIITHPDCTFCEKDKWPSYRREKENYQGAAAFIIHLK